MEIINNASITETKGGMSTETFMSSYSPEEQEQNIINSENSKRVFSPEFIPLYIHIQKEFNLTDTESKIYGFIRFYMSSGTGRFYFTDKQLGEIANCNERTAGDALRKLGNIGLISTKRRVKAGGGQIRFVEKVQFRSAGLVQLGSAGITTSNNNKIKENNINISQLGSSSSRNTQTTFPNRENLRTEQTNAQGKVKFTFKEISRLKSLLIEKYPTELLGVSDEKQLRSFWLLSQPRKDKDQWMSKDPWENIPKFLAGYISSRDEKYLVRSMSSLNQFLKDWRERGGTFKLTAQNNGEE